MAKVLKYKGVTPIVFQVTIQPPGRPSYDALVRPFSEVFLTEMDDGQTVWALPGVDLEAQQLVVVPIDWILNQQVRLLKEFEVLRVMDARRVFGGIAPDGPHDYSDEDLRDPAEVIDPAWQPPSANGHAPAPAAPASGPAGGATTPPG